MITSVIRLADNTLQLSTDTGVVKLQTRLPNFEGDVEDAIQQHQYRVEQLTPQPKVEFERDPEDYDD